jgi:fructooligosaccharide transport system substrate-binding protein
VWEVLVSNYAANGIIVPITSYVSEESKNDMLPSTVLQNTYQNDMYTVSFNEAVSLFYYNKDVFEEHGFRIPEGIDDAYTLDEVYEMAKEVSTPEMVGIKIIMNKGEGLIYGLSPLFDSAGAPLVSEDGSKADGYINSEKSVETAVKLQKFFDDKLANIDPTPTEFQDQKAAMWIAGNINQVVQFDDFPDLHWGATYLPKTGDHVVSNCGSWTLGISKDCKDPDAAYVALEFMTNSESTRLYGEVGGYPPARKSAYENNTQWDEYPYSLAKEQLFEAAVPRPKTPVYTVLTSKFAEAMLDIFTGSDAKESLDAVASYVDDEYARVKDSIK